jgi:4-amino-4-deoxy-L-arabinose transferase-like glycosyltransferase
MFIFSSRYATEDAIATLLTVLTFYFILRAHETELKKHLAAAAFSSGLAVSAKATLGVLLIPLVLIFYHVHISEKGLLEEAAEHFRYVLSYSCIAALAYILTTPSIIVYPEIWLSDVIFEIFNRSSVYSNAFRNSMYGNTAPGWINYISGLISVSGYPVSLILIIGMGAGVWRLYTKRAYIHAETYLISYVLLTYIIIGSWENIHIWYILPLIPPASIIAAIRLSELRVAGIPDQLVDISLAILILSSTVYIGGITYHNKNDSRVESSNWSESAIIEGETVDVYSTHHSLPSFPDDATVKKLKIYKQMNIDHTERAISRAKCGVPEYIVISELHYSRYLSTPGAYPSVTNHFKNLIAGQYPYQLEKEFGHSYKRLQVHQFRLNIPASVYSSDPNIMIFSRNETAQSQCRNI